MPTIRAFGSKNRNGTDDHVKNQAPQRIRKGEADAIRSVQFELVAEIAVLNIVVGNSEGNQKIQQHQPQRKKPPVPGFVVARTIHNVVLQSKREGRGHEHDPADVAVPGRGDVIGAGNVKAAQVVAHVLRIEWNQTKPLVYSGKYFLHNGYFLMVRGMVNKGLVCDRG